jgi:hypothetical protein
MFTGASGFLRLRKQKKTPQTIPTRIRVATIPAAAPIIMPVRLPLLDDGDADVVEVAVAVAVDVGDAVVDKPSNPVGIDEGIEP